MQRISKKVALALGVAILLAPVLASAERVLFVVGVDVKPGKLDQYVSTVSKARGIIDRLELEGTMRMWRATVAGQNTGNVAVGIEYPSLAAYAEATTKMQADKEWQTLLGGLDAIRTLRGSGLYRALDDSAAASGGTLQAVTVRVEPGKLDAYMAQVDKLRGIQERLGTKGQVRRWQAMVAGENTGNVLIGIEYPSLDAYAESTTKFQADGEWRSLIGGLDGMRTLLGTALWQEIGQ